MRRKGVDKLLLLWYSHPRMAIAAVLVAINLFVILLFTVVLSLVSGNSFGEELSYLFTYTMCSDGIYDFVNDQEDVACFIIKIILTVIQMVIFSGALIGFTTDVLQTTFDKRLENKDRMILKDHFVFLNWSTIGQNIIHDMSFLEGKKTVVVLSEQEREDVLTSIDNIFTATNRCRKGLRIFVKKGSPTSSKHLSDISIARASYVGILLSNIDDMEETAIHEKDIASFKLLLTILGEAPNANIVVETTSEMAKEKIEQLIHTAHPEAEKRVAVFSHNAVMGHLLGRATIHSGFAYLFHHILSFEGAEFYGVPSVKVEDALQMYSNCIPIVNYDDDDVIDEDGVKSEDQLYILCSEKGALSKRGECKSFVKSIPYRENIVPEDFTLFVFSDSNRAQFVTMELVSNNIAYGSNVKYHVFSYSDDIQAIIQRIEETPGKRKVLLMSEENDNLSAQDVEVFLCLLELKRSPCISEEVEILVEIVNIDNLLPIKNLGIASVILSNKVISLYMLQLLTHKGSGKFFKDVIMVDAEEGEIDFEIVTANQLLDMTEGILEFNSFSEVVHSFYYASGKKKTLVGYFPDKEHRDNIIFFCDNTDDNRLVQINAEDELIVVTYR